MPPLITLTTDFGSRDPFVGIMKGVILSICPAARLVDLTHELAPQDVLGGRLALESAVPFFPDGTVHLAVVDPGVGTARRPIAIRCGRHHLVGPDNGVLSFALEHPGCTVVALAAPEYRLPEVSATFHGRDIFAPAAAHLAAGLPLERLGLSLPGCRLEGGAVIVEVLDADHFGNLITSIASTRLAEIPGRGVPTVEVNGRPALRLVGSYAEGGDGEPAAIAGSTGRL